MENKTRPTGADPAGFVASVEPPARRDEAAALLRIFTEATGVDAFMYGGSIVAFGPYRYRYASGREGDGIRVGFSPRKAALTLYGLQVDGADARLESLGRHTTGKGCVYIKRLADVDESVLHELIATAFAAPRPDEVA